MPKMGTFKDLILGEEEALKAIVEAAGNTVQAVDKLRNTAMKNPKKVYHLIYAFLAEDTRLVRVSKPKKEVIEFCPITGRQVRRVQELTTFVKSYRSSILLTEDGLEDLKIYWRKYGIYDPKVNNVNVPVDI